MVSSGDDLILDFNIFENRSEIIQQWALEQSESGKGDNNIVSYCFMAIVFLNASKSKW